MTDIDPKTFVVTCTNVNEDGSADIDVEIGPEMNNVIVNEGINFLLIKGMLEGNTDDILRWARRGKQEENTDGLMKKFGEIYNEDTK